MPSEPTAEQRAAWALRRGDPLTVLTLTHGAAGHVALAIRGAALAQLEENADAIRHIERALRGAERAGDGDTAARAALALAEIQIAARDLRGAAERLEACELALRSQHANRALAAVLRARIAALRGDHVGAQRALAAVDTAGDDFIDAVLGLAHAEVALGSGDVDGCNSALAAARRSAERARHGFLLAEIDAGVMRLRQPAARVCRATGDTTVDSFELSHVRKSREGAVLDSLRATFCVRGRVIDLSRRPILFAVLRTLLEARGEPVDAAALVRSFGARQANEAHRANLRVEIGRLRKLLPPRCRLDFAGGYRLDVGEPIAIVAPLGEVKHGDIAALLSDGQAWRAEEIAETLGISARTAQRRLAAMKEDGQVRVAGSSRGARWSTVSGETFTLLGQISALWWERPA